MLPSFEAVEVALPENLLCVKSVCSICDSNFLGYTFVRWSHNVKKGYTSVADSGEDASLAAVFFDLGFVTFIFILRKFCLKIYPRKKVIFMKRSLPTKVMHQFRLLTFPTKNIGIRYC